MSDPMKIRALMKDGVADIRVLMSHPMETGLRKDDAGNAIPAHFIQTLTIAVNGKTVVSGQTNTSVSKNPVFGFKVNGAKAGDKVSISWTDNRGEQRSDETVIR